MECGILECNAFKAISGQNVSLGRGRSADHIVGRVDIDPLFRVGTDDRAGRVDKEPGAREFAVFVDRVNLNDRGAAAFEDRLDLTADRAGRGAGLLGTPEYTGRSSSIETSNGRPLAP